MMRNSHRGRKEERDWVRPELPTQEEPAPQQRLWFRIGRTGSARFLSHLEAMNAWIRAMRRANIPLAYSQGFHPHPKVAFSAATPAGEETIGDYMDVVLTARDEPGQWLSRMREKLPDGFHLLQCREVPLKASSLMGLNDGGEFSLFFRGLSGEELRQRLGRLLSLEHIEVPRRSKKRGGKGRGRGRGRGRRTPTTISVDIRPMIVSASVRDEDEAIVDLRLKSVDGKPPKPREYVSLMVEDTATVRVMRRETFDPSGRPLFDAVGSVPSDDSAPQHAAPPAS